MANNVDPGQTAPKEQFDLGLHCLHRSDCWNIKSKYCIHYLFNLKLTSFQGFDGVLSVYRIRPNYRTVPYKRTVKQFRSLQVTADVFVYLLLYKSICCGYSFELPQQVEAIQMHTYSKCFYKDIQKQISHKHH